MSNEFITGVLLGATVTAAFFGIPLAIVALWKRRDVEDDAYQPTEVIDR